VPIAKSVVYDEAFFAACDKEAGENAVKASVDAIMSSPAYSEFSEGERKQCREQWTASFRKAMGKGDQFLNELYKDFLEEAFLERQEEAFSNRTRIGRALNLFDEGVGLPTLHSFLSMCLVLETLFTTGKQEITYQFTTRLAKITGETQEQRRNIYERARKVYDERSNVVHGRKLIETIELDVLRDAFYLSRQALQHILCDDKLLALYSDPITSDKTKDPDRAVKAIKDYFLNLDLQ